MPLIRRNYKDLSPEKRRAGAKAARARIQGALATPGLNAAQVAALQSQLDKISQWEAGQPIQAKSRKTESSEVVKVLKEAMAKKNKH